MEARERTGRGGVPRATGSPGGHGVRSSAGPLDGSCPGGNAPRAAGRRTSRVLEAFRNASIGGWCLPGATHIAEARRRNAAHVPGLFKTLSHWRQRSTVATSSLRVASWETGRLGLRIRVGGPFLSGGRHCLGWPRPSAPVLLTLMCIMEPEEHEDEPGGSWEAFLGGWLGSDRVDVSGGRCSQEDDRCRRNEV